MSQKPFHAPATPTTLEMPMPKSLADDGMTLLELLIIVSIISILAVLLIPSYWTFTSRAQANEAIELLSGATTAVNDYVMEKGSLPNNADFQRLGLTYTGEYTESITSDGANTLTATLKPAGAVNTDIAGKTVRFIYSNNSGWSCRPGSIPPEYLSSACQ